MPRKSDVKVSKARDKEGAVHPATTEPASAGDEEPIEPSSPPCYLREFSEDAPEGHQLP
jgi:hypothetical protein